MNTLEELTGADFDLTYFYCSDCNDFVARTEEQPEPTSFQGEPLCSTCLQDRAPSEDDTMEELTEEQ
jgi:hypothetical protein